jgi:hypothetical protein
MTQELRLAGISISGRIQAAKHMRMLEDLVHIIHRCGWGIASACQTKGDRHVVRTMSSIGGFTIGFFSNRIGDLEFKGIVSRSVNYYQRDLFDLSREVYGACGKNWDYLSPEQQRMFVRYADISRNIWGSVIWEGDQSSSLFGRLCAVHRRPVFYLPEGRIEFIDFLSNQSARRVSNG